jgi:hypothetical protein
MTPFRVARGLIAALACSIAFAQQTAPPSQPVTSPPTTGPSGKLELSPTEFRFGETWQGFPAEREFTVKNVGVGPLTVQVISSCGCTVVTAPKSPLEPGESSTFKIGYQTSNLGTADRRVTVTTSDPNRSQVGIPVQGTVKPLYEIKPGEHIIFDELDSDSHASGSIRIESKYPGGMSLKMMPGQEEERGPFDVQLTEVEPGHVFDVSAATKPPLPVGRSLGTVNIETGLPNVAPIQVRLFATVPPRVSVQPDRLFVTRQFTQPMQQTLRLVYRQNEPVEVTGVQCDLANVTWEILAPSPPPEGSRMAFREIRVTVPGFAELPATGGKLDIHTDAGGEYEKLTVSIERRLPKPRRLPRPPAPPGK